ncbi:unnamed protein product, partial [Polarella glacialis]
MIAALPFDLFAFSAPLVELGKRRIASAAGFSSEFCRLVMWSPRFRTALVLNYSRGSGKRHACSLHTLLDSPAVKVTRDTTPDQCSITSSRSIPFHMCLLRLWDPLPSPGGRSSMLVTRHFTPPLHAVKGTLLGKVHLYSFEERQAEILAAFSDEGVRGLYLDQENGYATLTDGCKGWRHASPHLQAGAVNFRSLDRKNTQSVKHVLQRGPWACVLFPISSTVVNVTRQ